MGTTMGQIALGMGINLAMAGIQQMMAPDPSTDSEQDESYIFQGSKQNIVEGPSSCTLWRTTYSGRTVSFHTRSERTQFYNSDQRATSSQSNGQGYDQAAGVLRAEVQAQDKLQQAEQGYHLPLASPPQGR